ncbi:MAG: ABC transporter substrate-binding protein [Bacillota bacterium]|nr:ABC transporter substrate-binding protein [Bacillota bacterium]
MSEQITGELNKKVDLLALLPCPIKVPLQMEFENYFKGLNQEGGLNCIIEANANNQLNYNKTVEEYTDVDEIPDITITSGVNSFYYKGFRDKFVSKGYFYDATSDESNSDLIKYGIKDPDGNYTIISMNLLVLVVNLKLLGDINPPATWGDLLKPEFQNKVALRGHDNSFCETTLLTIYKNYGYEGIKQLGKAVRYGWHPSQMVKAAIRGGVDDPAISIIPYFFTSTLKNKKGIQIIWPKDGAIVSPVTMMVKKSSKERMEKIINFFTGVEVGNIFSGAFFPSLNPKANNELPEDVSLNWLGWDFIKENDLGELIKELNNVFFKAFRGDEL